MQTQQASTIAKLNDEFRKKGLAVTVTTGVQGLSDLSGLLEAVREYGEFWDGVDPHGEHDFGTIVWAGKKTFWKIDYYNESLDGWSDPAKPECIRVFTLMLAAEY
jgi:hypothetical protein